MNKIKTFLLKRHVQTIIASLVVFLAVWIVYVNSLGNKFLWDDQAGIVMNNYVHDLKYFLNFFSESMYAGKGVVCSYWRPLVLTVFALEWNTFLMWTGGYHMVNIALHAINALLVFFLFRALFNRFFIAFLTALVFGIHPLNTEAITYISGIADPLCAMFVLLGTIAYVKAGKETRHQRKRLLLFSVFLSFILALMSRESAIMMPGLLFLVDIFNKRSEIKKWRDIKIPFKTVTPFLLFDGFYIILRLTILDFTKWYFDSSFTHPLHERLFTFFHSFLIYLKLMFVPLHLHMEWIFPVDKTLFSAPILAGGALLALFVYLIFKTFKTIPEVSFGLMWFLIALSPSMNILMPAAAPVAEHWLYVSLSGFFFALFVLVEKISSKWKYQWIILIFLMAWILWIGNLTILRNRDWSNEIVLFESTLKESPNSARAHINLGLAYGNAKEYNKSLFHLGRAMELEPKNPLSYYLRALIYERMGKHKESMRDHEYSVSLDVNNTYSMSFLLYYYTNKNDYPKIRWMLEQSLEDTQSLIVAEKTLLQLIGIAQIEKSETLIKKYTIQLIDVRKKIQNEPMVRIGNFLNKYLGEPN
jgi:tetratricopeptide (TPR) repeat protein